MEYRKKCRGRRGEGKRACREREEEKGGIWKERNRKWEGIVKLDLRSQKQITKEVTHNWLITYLNITNG